MRTRVKLIDKRMFEDHWIAKLENISNPQEVIEMGFSYPDDIEIGEEFYLELIELEKT